MSPKQKPQKIPWRVEAGAVESLLRVMHPGGTTKPAAGEPPIPPYLRLYARRPGFRGRLTPYPVLRTYPGGTGHLTVSPELKLKLPADADVETREVSERAYRWYRLSLAAGSLTSALGVAIGALLVALGALGSTNTAMIIVGVVLTLVAGLGSVVSSWRAPIG